MVTDRAVFVRRRWLDRTAPVTDQLGTTPAVAAGVELKRWGLEDAVEMTAEYISAEKRTRSLKRPSRRWNADYGVGDNGGDSSVCGGSVGVSVAESVGSVAVGCAVSVASVGDSRVVGSAALVPGCGGVASCLSA